MTKDIAEIKELIMVVDQDGHDASYFLGLNEKKSPSATSSVICFLSSKLAALK
jgi:hypothetical protein